MAGESVNPRRDVPLSIAYTLVIVSITYVLAATALSGMVSHAATADDGSLAGSSFVLAFAARGWQWACQVHVVVCCIHPCVGDGGCSEHSYPTSRGILHLLHGPATSAGQLVLYSI